MNIAFLAGLGFLTFSLYMLNHALRNNKKALASRGWPSTEGHLREVTLWGSRNIGGQMKEVERLKVMYEYEIQGKLFAGNTVAFYTLVYPETLEFAKHHPQHTHTKVYYNPAQPDESVLITGPKPGNKRYSEIILSGVGIIASAAIMVFGWFGVLG